MKWIKILELCGEGGGIDLFGVKDEKAAWYFKFTSDESIMANLLSDEDAKGMAFKSESRAVQGINNALEMLDKRYSYWANFHPEVLHPEFAETICRHALSRKRCRKDIWEEQMAFINSTENPIATVQQFEKALMKVEAAGLPDSHLEMLNAQCRAKGRAISAAKLAKSAGYKSYHGANLQYGRLAFNVAEALGYSPAQGSDGTPNWWTTLSYSNPDAPEAGTGHFQFIMRPELAKALFSLGWIRTLQNRVTPYGELEAISCEGNLMGNRSKLHDNRRRITKKWGTKRWIYCKLKCGNIHREIMSFRSYTELFFLDEATALSAGHRPCSSCMRKKAVDYQKGWLEANPSACDPENESLAAIDKIVHMERIDQDNLKTSFSAKIEELSDGVFIEWEGKPYVIQKNRLLEWSHERYLSARDIPFGQDFKVLTPKSIVRYLKKRNLESGYIPDIHKF